MAFLARKKGLGNGQGIRKNQENDFNRKWGEGHNFKSFLLFEI